MAGWGEAGGGGEKKTCREGAGYFTMFFITVPTKFSLSPIGLSPDVIEFICGKTNSDRELVRQKDLNLLF